MNIKVVAACVVAALVVSVGVYVHNLRSEIKSLQEANVSLSTKLSVQNAAILQMKADADVRLKAAEASLAQAKEAAQKHQTKATVIYKTRPSSDDTCKDALELINRSST